MAHMSHRTPSDPASQPEHNRTMLERVRQNVRRLVNQATPRHIHANPFGKALDKPDDIVDDQLRVRGIDGLRVADLSIMPIMLRQSSTVASELNSLSFPSITAVTLYFNVPSTSQASVSVHSVAFSSV